MSDKNKNNNNLSAYEEFRNLPTLKETLQLTTEQVRGRPDPTMAELESLAAKYGTTVERLEKEIASGGCITGTTVESLLIGGFDIYDFILTALRDKALRWKKSSFEGCMLPTTLSDEEAKAIRDYLIWVYISRIESDETPKEFWADERINKQRQPQPQKIGAKE